MLLLMEDVVLCDRSAENDCRIRRTWWRIRGRLDDGKLENVPGQTEGHLQLVAGGTATTVGRLLAIPFYLVCCPGIL